MKVAVFGDEAPLDCQPVPFAWKPEAVIHIYRSGRRQYQRASQNGQGDSQMAAVRALARAEKMTMGQLQALDGDTLQAKIQALPADLIIEEIFRDAAPGDVARHLVQKVTGEPLIVDDEGNAVDWHHEEDGQHAGTFFLESAEEYLRWVLAEANRIQGEFSGFLSAAAGNSLTSSASNAEAGEVEQ